MPENENNQSEHGAISHDTLFDGRLVCKQRRGGYRFSIDPVLVAHYPLIKKHERILDLGCGCGIIGLILCYRHTDKNISVTGVEMQAELAQLARLNVAANGYKDRFSIIEANLHGCRELFEPESFSQIIANPPFYRKGSGRLSSNHEAMVARHQGQGGLSVFVDAASYAVKNRGRVNFIYPAELAAELIFSFQRNRIIPKRMQLIYPYPDTKRASLVLVEGIKNGGTGVEIANPLYIYEYRNGPYSKPVLSMFQPGGTVP